jgi:two-component system, OmpR family, phosphate regulon sensor histidine kinase PhoR
MAKSRNLVWQTIFTLTVVFFVSIVSITLYASSSFRKYYSESVRTELVSNARMFADMLSEQQPALDPVKTESLCRDMSRLTSMRFTVILPGGLVIGDSSAEPSLMQNHLDRPEIQKAFEGGTGLRTRFSFTVHETMIYAAVPITHEGKIIGVSRTSLPSVVFDRTLRSFLVREGIGICCIVFLVILMGIVLSLRVGRTFREVIAGAERFAAGDLGHRLHVRSYAEIDALADAMNRMADQLDTRIGTITSQRNLLKAVFSSMTEGVIAVDTDERVIDCNQAAEALFSIDLESARGRTIQEVIRNPRLQNFIKRVLESGEPVSVDTILQFLPERYIEAHGTLLCDSGNRTIGALIVLNDVTNLKKLENIRRDFVANVSHELRTPITSIKGFVETLRDGGVDDPATTRRFLDIILKHSDRLNSIIEDLLALSRIEQEAENESVRFERVRVIEILRNAALICDRKARGKAITIDLECPEELELRCNSALIEQAVANLLDNAIKYSDPESRVTVEAAARDDEITITVVDDGIGIPGKELSRIFERFYRVDKARSREMGGTGLGLAIVKHIANAHGGSVTVVSAPGSGSRFTLHFPLVR